MPGAARGIRKKRMPKDLVSLASHILDSKAGRFDPSKFKGSVRERFEEAHPAQGQRQADRAAKGKEEPGNVVDLMEALRSSIKGRGRQARNGPERQQARHEIQTPDPFGAQAQGGGLTADKGRPADTLESDRHCPPPPSCITVFSTRATSELMVYGLAIQPSGRAGSARRRVSGSECAVAKMQRIWC
jgi:hypothetical protein